jgi:hypothetical protein
MTVVSKYKYKKLSLMMAYRTPKHVERFGKKYVQKIYCVHLFRLLKSGEYTRRHGMENSTIYHLSYKNQSVNSLQEKIRCLFCDPYKTHKNTVWAELTVLNVQVRGKYSSR